MMLSKDKRLISLIVKAVAATLILGYASRVFAARPTIITIGETIDVKYQGQRKKYTYFTISRDTNEPVQVQRRAKRLLPRINRRRTVGKTAKNRR